MHAPGHRTQHPRGRHVHASQLRRHRASLEDDDAVRQLRELVDVGRGEQNGGSGSNQALDLSMDLGSRSHVDAGGRVVEQEQVRT